jgi:hypothetical protein
MSMFLLALALLIQDAPQPAAATAQRTVYEAVIHDRGKTIGSLILLEVNGSNVIGWIQKHDFVQMENGAVTPSGYTFQAAGNKYEINTRTGRILYSGPDGAGDQRVAKMEVMKGRVYKITEETEEGRTITFQTDHGEIVLTVDQRPTVWKHAGPPIAKWDMDRFEEILGKTVDVWRIRTGGAWTMEVIEEPAGMDIPAHLTKEKKKKK